MSELDILSDVIEVVLSFPVLDSGVNKSSFHSS